MSNKTFKKIAENYQDIKNEKLYWLRTDTLEKGEVTLRELLQCINSDTGFHEDYFVFSSEKERETRATGE